MKNESLVRKQLKRYLNELGIYSNNSSHDQIIECVLATLECEVRAGNMVQIYTIAGRRTNKSKEAVEKSIRGCINKCIFENRMDYLNSVLGYSAYNKNYPPSVSAFICLLADKIEDELNEKIS